MPDVDIKQTFFALCKNVGSPHALAAWIMCKYDHNALVDLAIDPAHYGDTHIVSFNRHATPQFFAYDLLVTEYLSKYKGLELQCQTKEVAISKFNLAESRCAEVNRKLKDFRRPQTARLEAIISIARRKISEVLGLRNQAQFDFGWGPGATFTIKSDVGWDTKILEKRISVTASALPLAQTTIGADLHWCHARGIPADAPCSLLQSEFVVVPGNRITTVPKNAKTDRTIAIEPTANIFLQKGIGSWLRQRLGKVARLSLNDRTLNQKFAARLDYATIDLAAASDTISIEIVKLLLPEEWIFLLDALRSPKYQLGGTWRSYEKWSSMGNGYTFELESLIFWALCVATLSIDSDRSHAVVFGDDILVPVHSAESCIATLIEFGFEVNQKKTHFRYLYRESCGAHFYNGLLVTPIYQKEVPNHVEEIYHMANRLRHVALRLGGYHYSDRITLSAWNHLVRLLKKSGNLNYTPLAFCRKTKDSPDFENISLEGAIHLSIEDCYHFGLAIRSYGTASNYLVFVPKKRKFDQAAGLCYRFQVSESLDFEDTLTLRGRGRVRMRRKTCRLSFGSNIWL